MLIDPSPAYLKVPPPKYYVKKVKYLWVIK
jgi:hypothetical protein